MAGKRPDQHTLDPSASDYKFRRRPEDGQIEKIDKGAGQPIKPTAPSPDANNPVEEPAEQDEG